MITKTVLREINFDDPEYREIFPKVKQFLRATRGALENKDFKTFNADVDLNFFAHQKHIVYEVLYYCNIDVLDSHAIDKVPNAFLVDSQYVSTLYIPDHIECIGVEAFYSSKIERIHLPRNLNSIELNAFISCYDLTTIEMPHEYYDKNVAHGVSEELDSALPLRLLKAIQVY